MVEHPNCRIYPCYIKEGDIDKPLLTIFSRRDIEPSEQISFNYQGRYPAGEGDDEDPQDEGSEADDQREVYACAAECIGTSPRFSIVVGQSLIIIFRDMYRRDVRMRDEDGILFLFLSFRYLNAIYPRLNYLSMHRIWTQESVIKRKIGV